MRNRRTFFFYFYNTIYGLLLARTISKRDELISGLKRDGLKKPSSKGTLSVTYIHIHSLQ